MPSNSAWGSSAIDERQEQSVVPRISDGGTRILNLFGKNRDSFSVLDRLPFFFLSREVAFSIYPLLNLFLALCARKGVLCS